MKKKRFMGMSPIFVKDSGELKKFYTTASNEGRGERALRRKMNKERGCVPNVLVPGMEVMEITEIPNPRHAP
ncbi:MAG: hypothetical protein ABIG73_01975 [Patescibacteria group bacterium]